MKRNAVRIVCDPYTNRISYFFRNELGEWMVLAGSSPLSRQYYTRTTIKERHKDIIIKLDEIYNRKNKGLDIFFEGTSTDYNYISDAVKAYLPKRDIVCQLKMTKIAVVGKKGSGKSTLIEKIADEQGYRFETIKKDHYVQHIDKSNNICWIELNGFDSGKNNISKAITIVQNLVKDDLSTVIYCISGDSGRIEDTEKNFIEKINAVFSEITVLTVLTKCYKEDLQKTIDEIEKLTNHMEVFPILAKEYKVREKVHGKDGYITVAPFGIKELCAFVFEGKKLPHQFRDELKSATTYDIKKQGIPARNLEENRDIISKKMNAPVYSVKEKNTVNTSSVEKKQSDLSSNKQSNSTITAPNAISKGVGDVFDKKDEKKVVSPLAKATKSDDIPRQKPAFKKIAIVGKGAVGKTTLIEGIGTYIGQSFFKEKLNDYTVYEDRKNNIQWYEVRGIDLGKDKTKEVYITIERLIADGCKTIFYCISGITGKIEVLETDLIRRLTNEYPQVSVMIILTMCYKEDIQDIEDKIKKITGKSKVIQTLAKDYITRIKIPRTGAPLIIPSFGLDSVYKYANGDN